MTPNQRYWIASLAAIPIGLFGGRLMGYGLSEGKFAHDRNILTFGGLSIFISAFFICFLVSNYVGRCPRCGAWTRLYWSFPIGLAPEPNCKKCGRNMNRGPSPSDISHGSDEE